ncbi:MAG TPA: FAD-dependent monooxygenase [Xanthobacteraceae bacterium]|nr:FAD-dependent monooxygenase [Xanthobacteraceae bacterium]
MSRPTAVIVGAGVAGLSAAWWLNKIGWHTVVVERANHLRDGGYMMGLSGPGYETARQMGILPKLEASARVIHENVYRDRNGRELLRLRYRDFLGDLPFLALRRTDLVRALHEAAAVASDIRLGTEAISIENGDDKVVVTVSGGTRLEADLLIGADGLHSWVRQTRFGPDETFLQPLGYRFAAYDLDDVLDLGTDFLSFAEPGRLSEYYTLSDGRLAALHVWRSHATGPVDPDARWRLLRETYAGTHRDVMAMMASVGPQATPILDDLTLVDIPSWHDGRTVLIGDAAHCLSLVSGQGAGLAMASAQILSGELSNTDRRAALAAHDRRLRPAVIKLQQRSRKMASVFIPESTMGFHLRNVWFRYLPRRILGRYFLNAIQSEILAAQTLSEAR